MILIIIYVIICINILHTVSQAYYFDFCFGYKIPQTPFVQTSMQTHRGLQTFEQQLDTSTIQPPPNSSHQCLTNWTSIVLQWHQPDVFQTRQVHHQGTISRIGTLAEERQRYLLTSIQVLFYKTWLTNKYTDNQMIKA